MANLSNINGKFLFTDGDFLLIGGATANSISATESGVAIKNSNAATLSLQNSATNGKNHTLWSNTDGSFNITDVGVATRFTIASGGDVYIPSGNVSIGNTSVDPSGSNTILQIYSVSVPRLKLQNSTTGTASTAGSSFYVTGDDLIINNGETNSVIQFEIGGGTPVMRMEYGGNVGIGTISPQANLHIDKNNASPVLLVKASGQISSTAPYAKLVLAAGSASGDDVGSNIMGYRTADFSSAAARSTGLKFGVLQNNVAKDAMWITEAQNVGIGTDSPDYNLEIEATDAKAFVHYVSASRGGIAAYSSQRIAFTTTGSSDDLVFGYNNGATATSANFVEHMRIDNGTGNVGINDTSPNTANLSIKGQSTGVSANYPMLKLLGQNTSSDGLHITTTGTGNNYYAIKVATGANSSAFNVTNAGNVGIGTTSPDAILETSKEVDGNQVGALLTNTRQAGTADSVSLNFGLGRTADGYIRSVDAIKLLKEQQWTGVASTVDAALVFSTVSNETVSERMRIRSDGYIQQGIAGTSTNAYYFFDTIDYGDSGLIFRDNTSTNSGFVTYNHGQDAMKFGVNGSERMRITSGGILEVRNGTTVGGELKLTGTDNDFTINGKRGQIAYEIFGTETYVMDSQQFYPSADNARNIGTGSYRFSVVYSANGVNTSDETLKENIEECDLGINFINSLKPKSYNFKDLKEDNDAYGKKRYGLIAQDLLQTELKDSVFGKKDGEYGLSYNDLIAPMIKSIQELKAEIELLKTQINN